MIVVMRVIHTEASCALGIITPSAHPPNHATQSDVTRESGEQGEGEGRERERGRGVEGGQMAREAVSVGTYVYQQLVMRQPRLNADTF
ncbi:hypothetical protein E2C01_062418 [Portunus trituberculatus]|uniref:Uncharacterized protein n=1 Tax=Portunus trituberculatus TaxID=210409 RepID=A0A5B7H6E0_PORTR|nr:hypothetical protein [Portunus trituberculatus]